MCVIFTLLLLLPHVGIFYKVGATFQSYGKFVLLWSDNMYSSDKTREVPLTGCGKDCQPFVSRLGAKQASAFCIFIPHGVW